jgi:hypothetical protein
LTIFDKVEMYVIHKMNASISRNPN